MRWKMRESNRRTRDKGEGMRCNDEMMCRHNEMSCDDEMM